MDTATAPTPQLPDAHQGVRHMPLSWLFAVFGALLVLTVVTTAASRIDLGAANVWIALGIATLKAVLVLLFFMHMLYERPMNAIVLCTALIFVVLFIGLVLLDTNAYNPELIRDQTPEMRR
jgi:cytochrome c oxidase subunit 4